MSVSAILRRSLMLVGPGRAGMALARSWIRAGGSLAGVAARTAASTRRAARTLRTAGRTGAQPWPECDLLVLAVPDDRIAGVARDLAGRVRCRMAFHLSGALTAAALEPLSDAGARVASLHPLRAFTGDPDESWLGTFVTIEGDRAAVEAGFRMSAALGATAYRIRSESKPLYHAAAALAAGGTMALLSVAVRAAVDAGLPERQARRALGRLASEAAAATSSRPFAEAFTGPVARRDVQTVRAHRRAASGRRDFLALYERLAEEILAETAGRGREKEIRAILDKVADAPRAARARRR